MRSRFVMAIALYDGQRRNRLILSSPVLNLATDAVYSTPALRELDYHVKKSPRPISNTVSAANFLVSGRVYTKMKIERHGQAQILTQQEIELLFNKGLLSGRSRTLFGVCLYTACRIAEACSLMVKDIYTNSGTVRSTINERTLPTRKENFKPARFQ